MSNPIGGWIAALGIKYGWHPSVLSLANFAVAALSSMAIVVLAPMAQALWWPGWLAALSWPLAYALDCADGQLARATGKTSESGARVDVISDYAAQTCVVTALIVVATEKSAVPVPALSIMASLWLFGTFAALLRKSDIAIGHSVVKSRTLASALRSLLDTGFINLLLGIWLLLSPSTVIIPALIFTVCNAAYLFASLARETRLSVHQTN